MFLSVNGTVQRLKCTKTTDLFIGENPLEKVQNYKYLGMWYVVGCQFRLALSY